MIVSYNSRATLRDCVEPIVAMPGVTVTVVDNASPDGSLEAIADQPVQRLEARRNGGFAFACNLGMALGRAPLVLFLNPDTRIEPADLERLAAVLASEPGLGIVGPRLLDSTGKLEPSLSRAQGLGSTWVQALFLHRLLPRAKWANETVQQPAALPGTRFATSQKRSPDTMAAARRCGRACSRRSRRSRRSRAAASATRDWLVRGVTGQNRLAFSGATSRRWGSPGHMEGDV